MQTWTTLWVASLLLSSAALADGESPSAASASPPDPGVPVSRLIAAVARKTGEKFVIDPRVKADILIVGQDAGALSYGDLLTVLHVYGFAAVEDGGYVQVVPDANARSMSIPTVTDKDARPAYEIVSAAVVVKNVSAAQLVPILRPLLPQYAHLAAYPCTNTLIVVDTFSSVRRIEGLVHSLDVGGPYKPVSCEPKDGASQR